jgi:5-methylthioribose kinase
MTDGSMNKAMGFQPFNNENDIIEFACQHYPAFASGGFFSVEEIGDGNINFVYRVSCEEGGSVIVKQALPYIRVIGEGWPLTQDRIRIEAEVLQQQAIHCADLVPEIYHFSAERCAIVMEDIGQLTNLRDLLIAGTELPKLSLQMGRFLADTLYFSSDFYLKSPDKRALVARFANPDLCQITEEVFFGDPYCDHPRNNVSEGVQTAAKALWQRRDVKAVVAELKATFTSHTQCLVHGDLHTGSVFADRNQTRVIDPEFAFVGPAGFDIGLYFANLLLNYCRHSAIEGGDHYQDWLLDQLEQTWNTFSERFCLHVDEYSENAELVVPEYVDSFLANLFADSLGYAGTEMIRRTIGVAHVADIETISDSTAKAAAENLSLKLGETLILKRRELRTIADLRAQI